MNESALYLLFIVTYKYKLFSTDTSNISRREPSYIIVWDDKIVTNCFKFTHAGIRIQNGAGKLKV